MFVFSQLIVPTPSPETPGGPLCEIDMFCHIVADLGWHPLPSGLPSTSSFLIPNFPLLISSKQVRAV